MAIAQTDIDNLEKALYQGLLTVEVDGERVTYRSVEQLQMALAAARSALNQVQGDRVTRSLIAHSRD
jgi:hypothetical protein